MAQSNWLSSRENPRKCWAQVLRGVQDLLPILMSRLRNGSTRPRLRLSMCDDRSESM